MEACPNYYKLVKVSTYNIIAFRTNKLNKLPSKARRKLSELLTVPVITFVLSIIPH